MTVSEFLLARIAEDEAVARSVDGRWEDAMWHSRPGDFLDRHDPARVLAECEAKCRIVGEHHRWNEGGPAIDEPEFWGPDEALDEDALACARCGYPKEFAAPWPCKTLRALAAVYGDHPDFREEWRA